MSLSKHHFRLQSRGFTLIELLVVMAVILVLASITFGITRGVQGAQARAKAQGELAVLEQALEQFKLRYGDYPWVDGNGNQSMTDALTGRKILVRANNGNISLGGSMSDAEIADSGRPVFIDTSRFTTRSGQIMDPWGNAYEYRYKVSGTSGDAWQRFGYILYSRGPKNKTLTIANSGQINTPPNDIASDGIILSGQ